MCLLAVQYDRLACAVLPYCRQGENALFRKLYYLNQPSRQAATVGPEFRSKLPVPG